MEFFKKRSTAWAVLALTIVACFFIGQAKKPSSNGTGTGDIQILPSGIYVQDKADVLSKDVEDHITKMNNDLVSKVGAEIQVCTVDTTGYDNIFDVATALGNQTNLGPNGCVFIIAVDDIDACIVQGDDLLYAFSDNELSALINNNFSVSNFENRKLDRAVERTFDGLIAMYENTYGVSISERDNVYKVVQNTNSYQRVNSASYVGVIILIIIILIIFARPRRNRTRRTSGPVVTTRTTTGYYPRNRYNTYTPGYPPRNTYPNTTTRTTTTTSRSGNFSSGSSRGASFQSGSSRTTSYTRTTTTHTSSSSHTSSSRSGGFSSGSSRGGSFSSGSRGGSFRK